MNSLKAIPLLVLIVLTLTQSRPYGQSNEDNERATYEYAVVEQKEAGMIIHYSSGEVEETKKSKHDSFWVGVAKKLEALSENGWEVVGLESPPTGGSKVLLKRKK